MAQFIALLIMGLTLPIWGGVFAAVIAAGFHLLFTNPLALLFIVGGLFIAGVYFSK